MLSANIFDEPLELIFGDIRGASRKASSKNLYLDAKTNISTYKFSKWLGYPIHSILKGKSYFDINFEMTPKLSQLTFASDMKGVSIDLPGGFRKLEESKLPLTIDWKFHQDNETINIKLLKKLKAYLKFRESKFTHGDIIIDDSQDLVTDKNSIPNSLVFSGNIDQLYVDEWLDVFSNYHQERIAMPVSKDFYQSGIDIKFRDLHIKKIKFEKSTLPQSVVNLDKVSDRWK